MEVHTLKLGFIPRADPWLLVWYHSLSIEDKTKFEGHFGFLGSLLEVKHDKDILESLITFWTQKLQYFGLGNKSSHLPSKNMPVFKATDSQWSGIAKISKLGRLRHRTFWASIETYWKRNSYAFLWTSSSVGTWLLVGSTKGISAVNRRNGKTSGYGSWPCAY